MSVSHDKGVLVIDNANSGTNLATTLEAAQYARNLSGNNDITLVIGQEEGDGGDHPDHDYSIDQSAQDQPGHLRPPKSVQALLK
jgi:hypothetical protein